MHRFSLTAAAVAALAVSAPASAATVSFTTGGSNYEASKVFTGSDGTKVKVTAFSFDSSGDISLGNLASWSGGLGNLNSSSDNSHTVDNSGSTDFLILFFDKSVQLGMGTFTTGYYDENNRYLKDTDAMIGYTNFAGSYLQNISGLGWAYDFTSLDTAMGFYGSDSGGNGTETRTINTVNNGNIWLIGAARTNPDQYTDGFKLQSLTFNATTVLPEPGTWAMLILGFGMIGGALRRRGAAVGKTTNALSYA